MINQIRKRPWLLVVIGLVLVFLVNMVFIVIAVTNQPVIVR